MVSVLIPICISLFYLINHYLHELILFLFVLYSSNRTLISISISFCERTTFLTERIGLRSVRQFVAVVHALPAGLCRQALRRKRRRWLSKKGLLIQGGSSHMRSSYDGADLLIHAAVAAEMMTKSAETDEDVMELERDTAYCEMEQDMLKYEAWFTSMIYMLNYKHGLQMTEYCSINY